MLSTLGCDSSVFTSNRRVKVFVVLNMNIRYLDHLNIDLFTALQTRN